MVDFIGSLAQSVVLEDPGRLPRNIRFYTIIVVSFLGLIWLVLKIKSRRKTVNERGAEQDEQAAQQTES